MEINNESPRTILRKLSDQDLQKELEEFRKKALELGASDAKIIPADYVTIDERVWMKCLVPRCPGLANGGSPHCPPNTPQPDFMRRVVAKYSRAVLFKRDVQYVPPSELPKGEPQKKSNKGLGFHTKTFEIVGRLESYIQSKGYYLALGLSGGSCKVYLCRGATCGVIENGTCRFPLKSRPSLEAVAIDVFGLAKKVDWDIHMIPSLEPDLCPIPGVSVGIVFIY